MKKIYKISITSVLIAGIGFFAFHYFNSNADDARTLAVMDVNECHNSTKSGNQYNECSLKTPYTWNITKDEFANNNQFNSWTDYDTVGATTVDTFNPNNLTTLTVKAFAARDGFEYFQLANNSWVDSNNFKKIPGTRAGYRIPARDGDKNDGNVGRIVPAVPATQK